MAATFKLETYLREGRLPTIWCPGCGIGTVVHSLARAIDDVGLDQKQTTLVSGIGCSSRAPGYMKFDSFHATHGRAIPVATGVKLAKPEHTVIVTSGDGDCLAIGASHFIHAARRNIDMTVILFDNQTYGMTGGQHAPTTCLGDRASTARYGNIEPPFNACELAKASGATYVARAVTVRPVELTNLIAGAIRNKGFSFVEVITQCPPYYGRANRLGSADEMLDWQEKNTIMMKYVPEMSPEQLEGKLITGVLHTAERPEFAEANRRLAERAAGEVR